MNRHGLAPRLLLSLGGVVTALVLLELTARIAAPDLPVPDYASPFRFDDQIGYELAPHAVVGAETMNSEGFRGPDRVIPKPANVYRVLAIGDSVVQAVIGGIRYEESWPKLLEDLLPGVSAGSPLTRGTRYEVINAGVGGYASAQAFNRLKSRGLKYQPDLVIVLVGSNDMYFSWLHEWRPGLGLHNIPAATAGLIRLEPDGAPDLWTTAKRRVLQLSYVARLVQRARQRSDRPGPLEIVHAVPVERRVPLNQAALDAYRASLERIHDLVSESGIVTAIVAYPMIVSRDLIDDLDALPTHPTVQDFVDAYERYVAAVRSFAATHHDVVLIDAAKTFSSRPIEQRARLFVDWEHLSSEGNRLMAEIAARAIAQGGIVVRNRR